MVLGYESNISLVRENDDKPVRDPEVIDYFGYERAILEQDYSELDGYEFILRTRKLNQETGQLDIGATAGALGIELEYLPRSTMLFGEGTLRIKEKRYVIEVPKEYEPLRQQFIFGHELGHVLIFGEAQKFGSDTLREFYRDSSRFGTDLHNHVEAFCDYFGAKMIGLDYPHRLPSLGQLEIF